MFGVCETPIPGDQPVRPCPIDLIVGEGRLFNRLDDLNKRCLGRIDGLTGRQLSAKNRYARIKCPPTESKHIGRQFVVDQALVQSPGRIVTHQEVDEFEGGHVGVGPGWRVISRQDQRHATDAAHIDLTFAILSRIQRVVPWQGPRRSGDLTKFFFDVGEDRSPIKFARNDQARIVGLVIKFVKGLQAINIHTLDICAGADGALTVVMPLVHRRQRL